MEENQTEFNLPALEQPDRPNAAGAMPPRIEPQYLQIVMQYWTNINQIIWQQLAIILLIQTSGIIFAVTHTHTIMGLCSVALAWLITIGLLWQIRSNQIVRTKLTEQVNYISEQLMKQFCDEREVPAGIKFIPYDLKTDRALSDRWVRHHTATYALIFATTMFDTAVAIIYNTSLIDIESFEVFGLRLL